MATTATDCTLGAPCTLVVTGSGLAATNAVVFGDDYCAELFSPTNPRNPRQFGITEGGRKRVSDASIDNNLQKLFNSVSCT